MNSATDIWSRVLDILKTELTSTALNTWFDDCRAVDVSDGKLVICSPQKLKRDVIENRFAGSIKAALYELFSGDFDLLILSEESEREYLMNKPASEMDFGNNEFTFENFVVGNSNRYAHAAAKAVADAPAEAYNPLFIYGESGLGKTHLLYSIGNVIKKRHPEFSVIYVKGDDFTNELINSIQTGKNFEFREKYRHADLLLVDDIQFIAGKIQTQEEFFHTFNTLYESKKQIVLTSDRPPIEILRLEDRLKTRFEWGLLADIQAPDYETRIAIIRNKARQLGVILPPDVIEYIAENLTSNVRQIEGAVKKIMAYRDLMEGDVNKETVSRVIKDMFKEKSSYLPTPDIIISETAKYYQITPEEIRGQRRTKNTALARQISMYLIRKHTNLSLKDIGDEYEGRDHTTVLTSIRKIEDTIKASNEFSEVVRDIESNINSRS